MTEALQALTSSYVLGGITLANRLVLGPHGTGFVDVETHLPTDRQASYLEDRAKGGVGLIIQGSIMVHETGVTAGQLNAIVAPGAADAFGRLADAVHGHGCPIFGQLSHLGRQGHSYASHRELWAPSAIADPVSRVVPHEMSAADIQVLVDAYRAGAESLLSAGFDGLEIYMAHGYLLGSFLSPLSNRRSDSYGGSSRGRAQLPLQILQAVRLDIGPNVPLGIRISADELVPNGMSIDEAETSVGLMAESSKLDFVSVSQSNYQSRSAMIPDISFPPAPYANLAGRIKAVVGPIAVMAAGRITPKQADELIAHGEIDLAVMVRPLIADPELPRKLADGQADQVRSCIYCNVGCRGGHHRGLPMACLVNPAVGFERTHGIGRIVSARERQSVLVVGGGPAGLKAAQAAAQRGHSVTLVERAEVTGGRVRVPPPRCHTETSSPRASVTWHASWSAWA